MFAAHDQKQSKGSAAKTARKAEPSPAGNAAAEFNGYWQSLALSTSGIQPKLSVSQPNDPSEQEADRVADRVMRMTPDSPTLHDGSFQVQRKCAGCEDEDELKLHRMNRADGQHSTSAPPRVIHEVLQEPGQPLDSATRSFFEPHFNHSFSGVRLHTTAGAAEAARSIDAYAFTLGQHVVLGAGQYVPNSRQYKSLLAHELTHVVQQGRGDVIHRTGPKQATPPPTTPPPVRAATPEERREFAREAITFLAGQGSFFTEQPDRDLAEILGHLRTTVENGLSVIAGDSAATTNADQLRTTYRDAVRTVLVSRTQSRPGSFRTPPTLQELFEQNVDNILPFGLPQATADTGAGELMAELEAPLPDHPTADQRARFAAIQSARQRLRVVTSQISFPVADLFSRTGGTTTIGLPANTVARFSSTIPAGLQRGLSNVAGTLAQGSLAANTTVMIALDLTAFGGGYDTYRFTRLDLGTTLGGEILIERQGSIGVETVRSDDRQRMRTRFDGFTFVRESGFSDAEFDQVLIGLGEIPDAQLSALGALHFARGGVHTTNPDAAAEYDQSTHTVTVFDRAYQSGMMRLGRPGRALTFAANSVVHEVGHAHDLSSLRTSAAAVDAAQAALLAEFGTGGTGFRIPARGDSDRARFDELMATVTAATTTERGARARSGARWNMRDPNEVTDTLPAREADPAFRVAVQQDSGRAGTQIPTTYPNPDSVLQEYFAESFALYQTSPDLLRRLRPHVFQYMQTTFPR